MEHDWYLTVMSGVKGTGRRGRVECGKGSYEEAWTGNFLQRISIGERHVFE